MSSSVFPGCNPPAYHLHLALDSSWVPRAHGLDIREKRPAQGSGRPGLTWGQRGSRPQMRPSLAAGPALRRKEYLNNRVNCSIVRASARSADADRGHPPGWDGYGIVAEHQHLASPVLSVERDDRKSEAAHNATRDRNSNRVSYDEALRLTGKE